jgi:Skp family chaperone for outer membrane proteins
MEQHEAYEKDMNIKLKKWEAKVDELKADMDKADAQTRESLYKEVEKLRDLQRNAREKLDALKRTGQGSFNDLKAGVDKAVKDLEEAVGSALSRLK